VKIVGKLDCLFTCGTADGTGTLILDAVKNLSVLRLEHEGQYSPLVVAIESELKKRDAAGLLLLPDLSHLPTALSEFSRILRRRTPA
jgi:hypothetical protein